MNMQQNLSDISTSIRNGMDMESLISNSISLLVNMELDLRQMVYLSYIDGLKRMARDESTHRPIHITIDKCNICLITRELFQCGDCDGKVCIACGRMVAMCPYCRHEPFVMIIPGGIPVNRAH